MEVCICTHLSNPFHMGGRQYDVVKTHIEEFERVSLGKGYYGILVKNPIRSLFHMAEERSGALVGTHKSKTVLIKMIKKDIRTSDKEVMENQVKGAFQEALNAKIILNEKFFKAFKVR